MKQGYPILLDVADRRIVIVGGGAAAARKAAGLLAAGARHIRVVSPVFDSAMPRDVHRVTTEFSPQHLRDAQVVFAATDSTQVNRAVASEAHRIGALVSRLDDENHEDFTAGAVHRDGAVTIAVWAGGSPAVAAKIRDGVKNNLESRWVKLADAMTELRPAILSANLPGKMRAQIFREAATEEAADRAVAGSLQSWIESRIGQKLAITI